MHIGNSKHALNYGLVLEKYIKWLNLIKMLGKTMNRDLRKKRFGKRFGKRLFSGDD